MEETLQIIGVGFGRTGTDSTRTALNQLGYPCYHMIEVLKNRGQHLGFWTRVAESPPGTQHDWNEVFADYRATVDNPAACVWRELLESYPDAKVLLTLHPGGAEAWYESTAETIYAPQRRWQWKVLELLTRFGNRMARMTRKLIWERFHRGTMENRKQAIERYHEHTAEVQAAVPEDRLLVFRASEGWEPLCRFLEVPVPDGSFPRVNDRESTKRRLRAMERVAYLLLGLISVVVAGLAWGLLRLFG